MTDTVIHVDRTWSDEDVTISKVYIDGAFFCHGLEDEYRVNKVPGETRIPAGTYRVTLRTEGGFHGRYSRMFGAAHKGMLWVRNVPGFKWILIHIGNYERDTDGCLLLGKADYAARTVWQSKTTYKRFYERVWRAAQAGRLSIVYRDMDCASQRRAA